MLRLAAARGLDLVQTARMLAMAHVAGGDAMIACFDAKYHYWFWRPYQAIPQADTDGNPATVADPSWRPLGATPNFPEYPSAHACHSTAVVEALDAFFGTDKVPFTLDSRVTGTDARTTTACTTSSRTSTGRASSSASTSATPTCKARPSGARSAATSPTTTSSRSADAALSWTGGGPDGRLLSCVSTRTDAGRWVP